MKELKKCPFCGGENIRVYDCGTPREPCWIVECLHCKVSASDYWDEDEAIKAWNTRTPVKRVIDRLIDEGVPFPLEDKDVGFAEGLICAIEIVKEEM